MLDEHQLRLRWMLRTHEHDDCLPGEAAALDALAAPRVQHRPPAPAHGAPGEPALLPFGNEHVTVLRTPGHTPGCLSFLWRDRLFCGGLLAVDACPVQPRPARPECLWHSVLNTVFTLPCETLLFAGHATQARAVSTVHEQRRWNPWFSRATRDEFLSRVAALPAAPGSPLPEPARRPRNPRHPPGRSPTTRRQA